MNGLREPQGLSILIKAFNEGDKIDAAITSALAVQAELPALALEVVVADGGSVDTTVALACRWARTHPVRVVQLRRRKDRNCGAGVELGYTCSHGQWLLFMDADMELRPGFVPRALQILQTQPDCAGVAGLFEEAQVRNGTDRIRQRNRLNARVGVQPWLAGGGLYRREAIEAAGGYAADARLAAYEEADLGLRLHAAGWRVQRIDQPAMRHHGHRSRTIEILHQRWRTGRHEAAGRLLRLHLGRTGTGSVLRLLAHPLALLLGWGVALPLLVIHGLNPTPSTAALAAGWPLTLAAAAMVHLLLKRDGAHVLTSWSDWHLLLAGIIRGSLVPLPPRPLRLAHRILADGTRCSAR